MPKIKLPDIPMDKASRMKRAREQGFDVHQVWLHGSTHDIGRGFDDPSRPETNYEPESHLGAGIYASDSIDDVNLNYAGEGPDLTGRIERRAALLDQEVDYDDDLRQRFEELAGKPVEDMEFDELTEISRRLAKEDVSGGHQGVIYPLLARTDGVFDERDNFLDLDGSKGWDEYMEDARRDPSLSADAEEWEIEDLARDLEASDMDDALGGFAASMNFIRDAYNGDAAVNEIIDATFTGQGISVRRIREILDEIGFIYEDYETGGVLTNSAVAARIAGDNGAKGIIMDAGAEFPHMDGTIGARHLFVTDPDMVRSINAAFDPRNEGSGDMLGAADPELLPFLAAAGAAGAVLLPRRKEIRADFGEAAKHLGKSLLLGMADMFTALDPSVPIGEEAGAEGMAGHGAAMDRWNRLLNGNEPLTPEGSAAFDAIVEGVTSHGAVQEVLNFPGVSNVLEYVYGASRAAQEAIEDVREDSPRAAAALDVINPSPL